ncbi:aquaporin-5 isoform X2 [Patella vulgata]|uniref:aquaporin-5 isoform X2 n=1 Tax=Patella vulgata TaxID=6465 RepID=UPI00217F4E0C|nr:aquaporin-5 isoform X2 [Patella vulgata]
MNRFWKENIEDLLSPNLWRSLAAETFGTLVIVLLGCGTYTGAVPSVIQVSLTFGLTVATVVWVFRHISGGHMNPAVTLAKLVTRRVSIVRGVLYIIAQCLGGVLGAGILFGLTPDTQRLDLGATAMLRRGVTSPQGFGVELLVTFVVVLAVFASDDTKRRDLRGSAPLTIGLAVVVCHLFAFPYTRCGLNPARSFGPSLVMGIWQNHWVFWIGPLIGGVVAGVLYEFVFSAGATVAQAKKCLLRSKPHPPQEADQELDEVKVEINGEKVAEVEETPEIVEAKIPETKINEEEKEKPKE